VEIITKMSGSLLVEASWKTSVIVGTLFAWGLKRIRQKRGILGGRSVTIRSVYASAEIPKKKILRDPPTRLSVSAPVC
jgi:hypothetical protein